MQIEQIRICTMLSPHYESQGVIQQDCCYSPFGDECLDDIKADLISLTLSDSYSGTINFDTKSSSFQSSPKRNCNNSAVPARRDAPSDSFLVISNSSSGGNLLYSSTETVTQYGNVQLHEACNISSQKVVTDSETLHKRNENLIPSLMEHTVLQQNANGQNSGFTQPYINQDKNKSFAKHKLSLSLHDVSRLPDFPLKCKSHDFSSDMIQSQSMTTISSGLKSKNSGLPRSVSCLSLNSGGKSYEHIQSKVKEYIRQIKKADERRKSPKLADIPNKSIHADDLNYATNENNSKASEKILAAVMRDLLYELEDREIVISKLQDNYDKLLIKYAEAVNRIDQLRFKLIDPSWKLASLREEQNHDFSCSESSMLNSTNKLTSPYNGISGMRADAKSLSFGIKDSFLNTIRANNDKITSNEKSCSSVAQVHEQGTKQNLTLNPCVKLYSSSVRLDKKVEPLSQNSRTKATEESFKCKLSLSSRMVKERSSLGRMCTNSVTQSNSMLYTGEHLGSTTGPYQRNMYSCMKNAVTTDGNVCDLGTSCEDMYELGILQPMQCNEMPEVSEVKVSKYTSGKETLCKKSLQQSESNTSVEKVSRWQESLPEFELIEPSCYGSLDCHSSGSKTSSSQNLIKKFASPSGCDSGYPHSEFYSFSVHPVPVKFSASQTSNSKTDVIETKKVSSRTEAETVIQPTHHKGTFQSASYSRTASGDVRMLDNSDDLHLPVGVTDSLKLSECSPSTVIPKSLNIDSCDCWNLAVEVSCDSKDSSTLLEPCDQKPKNTFQDFHVPPLKLGSLLSDEDDDTDGANNTCSSGVTALPETEENSKPGLCCSSYEECLSSSHQGASGVITYPASTCMTSDSQANKALNKVKVTNNKMCPSLSSASHIDSQELNCNLLKNCGRESERNHCLKDCAVEGKINCTTIQNDSLQTLATGSVLCRNVQPYGTAREMGHASTQQCCGGELVHLAQTNDHSISSIIAPPTEDCESSAHHAGGIRKSTNTSGRKLLGSALRCILLELFNIENCHCNGCICHRSSWKPVAPRNHIHHTSVEDEHVAAESDNRNISYTGTHVNLTSTLNGFECGSKTTLSTEEDVNSVMEIGSPKDSYSSRMSDVNSAIIPEDQSLKKVECNLMKCLHEMDLCAHQLKEKSETFLNILTQQQKPSS